MPHFLKRRCDRTLGDDGKLYEGQPDEKKAGRKAGTFGAGDTIGCGLVYQRYGARLFWTKNGKLLPELGLPASAATAGLSLRAAVGLGSPDDEVHRAGAHI